MDTKVQTQKNDSPHNKSLAFVDYIINRCQADNGLRAALKRADNPATEYQSWEVLAGFKVDLEYENQRLPYAAIGAAIARTKTEKNGTVRIGRAIANCYEDGNASDQAKAKLRRLLACDSVPEVCRILRPLFSLIEAKSNIALDYAGLLNDLLWFGHNDSQSRIKASWAQDFYGKPAVEGKDE
ncbi:type I-E CRISPR-associated protein Cse2/CasB [Nitrosomonas ureae]|uniref:CRISPR-associated protein, Cse2 family n=1 Tax=Nitrosomonas ureae TaxID=44577 RepID=A0A1H5STT8_9PROT|nr:type I-E CRISPR-associated protein Cse2/CasB [Nitrosomonas ureae]SEF53949.1 CRISPR-associated protein, Cse2 family [Nitrosomonas ureae]